MSDGTDVGLARGLSLFDLTMIGVGAMIGAGVFVLTGIGAGIAGPALITAFALNGAVTLLTAMVYAELGSAIPEAGGGYLWVQEALGPLQSFTAGWMSWFAHAVAGALYAIAFGAFGAELLHAMGWDLGGDWLHKGLGVLVTFLFVYINYRGASETGKAGNLVTGLKIAIIGVFIVAGLLFIWRRPVQLETFGEFFPQGAGAVITAMGLTFIAFEGYEIIAQAGEEVVEPKKNVPRAVFLSLLVVVPIYVLVAFTAIGAVVPPEGFATSWEFLGEAGELGLLEAAKQFMPYGFVLLIVGGLVSTMSALNATTFSSTRVAFAMGRDRVLPAPVGRVHPRTRTPVIALLLSGLIMLVMVLFVPIEGVAAAADIMFLLLFLQVNVTVVRIRRNRGNELDYGYKIPFFPYLPYIAIAMMGALAAFLFFYEPGAWGIAAAWILAGLIVYYVYAKDYQTRAKTPSEVVFEERPPEKPPHSVLVPVANPQTLPALVETAVAMAQRRQGEVHFLSLVNVPHQLPLAEGRAYIDERRAILDRAAELVDDRVPVRTAVRIGHDVAKDIVFTAKDAGADMVLFGWRSVGSDRSMLDRVYGTIQPLWSQETMSYVIENAPCDVAVVKAGLEHDVETVLVPIRGNRHAALAIDLAIGMARARGVDAEVLHLIAPDESEQPARELIRSILDAQGVDEDEIEIRIERTANIHDWLTRAASSHHPLVLGASERPWWRQHLLGETPERIVESATGTIVVVRRYEGMARSKVRELIRDLFMGSDGNGDR